MDENNKQNNNFSLWKIMEDDFKKNIDDDKYKNVQKYLRELNKEIPFFGEVLRIFNEMCMKAQSGSLGAEEKSSDSVTHTFNIDNIGIKNIHQDGKYIEDLKEQVQQLQEKNFALNAKDTNQTKEIEKLREENVRLKVNDTNEPQQIEQLKEENVRLKAKDTYQAQQIEQLKERNFALNDKDIAIAKQIEQLKEENIRLKAKDTNQIQQIEQLKKKNYALNDKDTAIVQQNGELKEENVALKAKDTYQAQQIEQLKGKNCTLNAKDTAKAQQIADLKITISDLKKENENLCLNNSTCSMPQSEDVSTSTVVETSDDPL